MTFGEHCRYMLRPTKVPDQADYKARYHLGTVLGLERKTVSISYMIQLMSHFDSQEGRRDSERGEMAR